jgi:hypothetical protein
VRIQITCPAEGQDHAVAQAGTAGQGICATGNVDPSLVEPLQELFGGAILVYAKIYQGFLTTTGATPDSDASLTTAPDGVNWKFDPLLGAQCTSVPPYVLQTLVAWLVAGGATVSDTVHFYGFCAAQTDCCTGSGGGSGPGAAGFRALARAGRVLSLAPRQWALTADDFPPGPGEPLNGRWLLTLRPSTEDRCVWDNGGCGRARPRVELCCESPEPGTWQLLLRHDGVAVRYTKPAGDWAALAANTLTADAPDGTGAPRCLTVTPV